MLGDGAFEFPRRGRRFLHRQRGESRNRSGWRAMTFARYISCWWAGRSPVSSGMENASSNAM
ncbi:hypothetical protein AWC19_18315 [Mycobacterium palustre]|uniref:Uncharacterized protein n=1 Tax=Mycobacterium palustre TaxID=153971 RepID=A0A1X1Z616_9MYCO|nr:hypothetical protein AWC19_18315 [Mycobacterium palustre]